jgi:hypothetical protein
MTVNKTHAVEFLVSLGFAKAVNWEDELLVSRLGQIPSKIDEDEVDEKFQDLYSDLANSDPDEPITFEGAKKSKKKATKKKAVAKPAPEPKAKAKKEKSKPVAKAKPAPAKKEKSKPVAKAKKAKPAKTESEVVERDKFGSRVGTISAKVNGAITDEWKEGKEIAKELGISFTQARARLYHANQEGIVECRRLVQYRLAKKKK